MRHAGQKFCFCGAGACSFLGSDDPEFLTPLLFTDAAGDAKYIGHTAIRTAFLYDKAHRMPTAVDCQILGGNSFFILQAVLQGCRSVV